MGNGTSNCTFLAPTPGQNTTTGLVHLAARSPVLVAVAVIGALSNFLVIVVLLHDTKLFSAIFKRLLIHQAVIDGLVCVLIPILGYATLNSTIYEIDLVLCYIIRNKQFYSLCTFVSAQGLICLALERYAAICKPLRYIRFKDSVHVFAALLICMYLYALAIGAPYFYTHTKYVNGTCITYASVAFSSNLYFLIRPYIWLASYYLIPIVISIILYSKIIKALRKSKLLEKRTKSIIIDKASSQLTKTAFTVTVLFAIFIGIDSFIYVLEMHRVVPITSYVEVAVLFSSVLNSFTNPFVYVICMPYFRRTLQSAFSCCCKSKVPNNPAQSRQNVTRF